MMRPWAVYFLYHGRRREIVAHATTEKGALSAAVIKHPAVPNFDKRLTIHDNLAHNTWRASPVAVQSTTTQVELPDPTTYRERDFTEWPSMWSHAKKPV